VVPPQYFSTNLMQILVMKPGDVRLKGEEV